MNSLQIISDSDLRNVNKPAQYLGGEVGSVVKNDNDVDIHFCLAFPDLYEVGMSHQGMQILYALINSDPKSWAERAFVPFKDMEQILREKNSVITSLESKRRLNEFNVVGFSLQYELSATGVLTILDLAKIPFRSADRNQDHPLIIGGGPVAYHPEPLADFFDAFLVGDGEESVPEFIATLRKCKKLKLSKDETLQQLAKIKGVYVPSFFEANYDSNGNFIGHTPRFDWCTKVERNVIASLEDAPYPKNPIVPNIRAVHDRLAVEVMRGCVRGCRFCQAGYLYRPQRERSPEKIIKIVEEGLANTGFEELSLLSLSTADYCSILPLLSTLKEQHCKDDNLAISFPSTRVDALKPELLAQVQTIRRSGFTIAPEAGTQRLRDVINKGVTDEEIIDTCTNVFEMGWSHIKMYFMIGLPTETDEDIEGIIELAGRVKKIAKRGQSLIVSVSTHVPKPHTPFQWAHQITEGETIRLQRRLFGGLKRIGVQFRYHKAYSTFLEGVFARGDRKLSHTLERAYNLGCRLDGWVEEINREQWERAFEECGIDPHDYLKARNETDPLPWDHISCDITKKYFLKEWHRSTAARTTPDCLTQSCSICGACNYDSKRNVLYDRQRSESRLNIIDPPWQSIIAERESALESKGKNKQSRIRSEKNDVSGSVLQGKDIGDLPALPASSPEFGSGSLDFIEPDSLIDYPFQNPVNPVVIHENVQHKNSKVKFAKNNPLNKPEQRAVQRIRVRYEKIDNFKFCGHLELKSILFRVARRNKLPILFSRGFSPKPKIILGPPLQLGIESQCEYVDFYLTAKIDPMYLLQVSNNILPAGLKFLSAQEVDLKSKALQEIIESQRYQVLLNSDIYDKNSNTSTALFKNSDSWQELIVDRKVKNNPVLQVPLKSAVSSLTIKGETLEFELMSNHGSSSLRPTEVIGTLTGMDPFNFQLIKVSCSLQESS